MQHSPTVDSLLVVRRKPGAAAGRFAALRLTVDFSEVHGAALLQLGGGKSRAEVGVGSSTSTELSGSLPIVIIVKDI